MPIKPHPTDPDKMVYVKREYNLPKEWVGLTAYEVQELHIANKHFGAFACAIEAKLKEKNETT